MITATDIKYAKALGRSIKLLASSYQTGDSYCALVAPFMLEPTHPLYNVNDVFNAVFVHGNVLGDAMFYGSGAGKLPTASAVVADIVETQNIWMRTFRWNGARKNWSLLITDSSKINILSVQQQTKLQSRKFLEAFPMYGQRV